PECGRGGHGVVPSEGSAAAGCAGDAPCARAAGGWRSGIRGWRNDRPGLCGTTRTPGGSAVMRRSSVLRTTGVVLLSVGTVAAVGTLVVRDQIARHQRNLFSDRALRRFAALGWISGTPASVELVQLLRDFCAWEPNAILRRRARKILARMERQLQRQAGAQPAGIAG